MSGAGTDVPNQKAGLAIAGRAGQLGYRAKIGHDVEHDAWTCYCTRVMLLRYDDVVAAQHDLDAMAAPFGGHCDGWGTFGNQEAVQQ